MKKIAILSLVASALISSELPNYELSAFLGGFDSTNSAKIDESELFGLGFAKKLDKNLMLNLSYFNSDIDYRDSLEDSKLDVITLNPEYYFMGASENLKPYLTAGIGYARFANEQFDNENDWLVNYGVGLKYLATETLSLKFEGKHLHTLDEGNNYFTYTVGFALGFGYDKPKPAPVPVVKEKAPLDSDNDGVIDGLDKCPDTPAGVEVNLDGCPLDSDKDGVYDYLDKCPDTPEGIKVNNSGCPLSGKDSDNDGIEDKFDKCPNTPAGVSVDANGCALDDDKDGVPNYLDKCPDTPNGFNVDDRGCKVSFRFNVNFGFDSSKLDETSKASVAEFAKFLDENSKYSASIEGHTDSSGSAIYNKKLSEKRAKTVYQELLNSNISKDRLEYKGYGEEKPKFDNKTRENRAKNRRVEGVLVTK